MKNPTPHSLTSPPNFIQQMFDATQFAEMGEQTIAMLSQYLAKNISGEYQVIEWQKPQTLLQQFDAALPIQPRFNQDALLQAIQQDVLQHNLHIHHPRNLGHQVATPLPVAALCDLVAALTNQAMAVYETGPSASMIERQIIRWLCELVGGQAWQHASGVLTSGGAQANLTALLAARQAYSKQRLNRDLWREGLAGCTPCYILASEHSHYSISRAAAIMGLGSQAVIGIACDADGRMQIDQLKQTLAHYPAHHIMAIVANAGCTPSGSIDPLNEIATVAEQHQIWFHVDGAHGASMLLSACLREHLQGIHRADSVVWDGHKLAYMPATVSAVLFRREADSFDAFSQQASYLFDEHKEAAKFDQSRRTLECTKRMMGLKWWAAFNLYGTQQLGDLVTHVFALAQHLAEQLRHRADFELLMTPQTNIVVFRYLGYPHQSKLRDDLVQRGQFHLTQVDWHGKTYLRTTLMNPMTTSHDIEALLEAIVQAGVRLQAQDDVSA